MSDNLPNLPRKKYAFTTCKCHPLGSLILNAGGLEHTCQHPKQYLFSVSISALLSAFIAWLTKLE